MERELISVIIPVYNVERFLCECIESVLCQTYSNLEVIIVDDGSTDSSPKICDEYAEKDSRIKVIHQVNGGQGKARNVGMGMATGSYYTFLDSDDYWNAEFVERVYFKAKQNDADIVISNYRHINELGEVIAEGRKTKIVEKQYSGSEAMSVALYWNEFGVGPWAKLYRAEAWKGILFKEDRIYEDLATTYLVYHKAKRIVFFNEFLMNYRIRENSDVHQKFNIKKVRVLDSADEILDYCKKNAKECIPAAESRQIASACFILFRIPYNEMKKYTSVISRCKNIIKKYRRNVMFDTKARKKTRIGAALSYLGFGIERIIFEMCIK